MPSPQATSSKSGTKSQRSGRRDPTAAERGTALVSDTTSQETPRLATVQEGQTKPAKRKRNRNRKHRNRRQSFLDPDDTQVASAAVPPPDAPTVGNLAADRPKAEAARPFYKLGKDPSNTSLESEALLDHRYAEVPLLVYLWCS